MLWNGKRHPQNLGAAEISAFLTHLAADRAVSAATPNQALNAIVFLYKQVLRMPVKGIEAERARRHRRLPTVLTVQEIALLFRGVSTESPRLAVRLIYGCGLRVNEALSLRIKDVDLAGKKLEIRSGKGDKDRVISLPNSLLSALLEHRTQVWRWHVEDRRTNAPGVMLPNAFVIKNPRAAESWPWF